MLGYLSNEERVNTFVTSGIGTNWLDPHGEHPYALHFDQVCSLLAENRLYRTIFKMPYFTCSKNVQATLSLPINYYRKAWHTVSGKLRAQMTSMLNGYAIFVGANVSDEKVAKEVAAMMEMELAIATKFNTDPVEKRQFGEQSNCKKQI